MKTRNEIYQGEGAQLLRFITTYHSLQYEQILRLFSKNRESIKSLITSLVKQKRIIYDKENGLLCDSQESANEYSCAVTPQVRQTGNRLSGLAGTAYASLFT